MYIAIIIILLPCIFIQYEAKVAKCHKCHGKCQETEIEDCDTSHNTSCELFVKWEDDALNIVKHCVNEEDALAKATCDAMSARGQLCKRCYVDLCNSMQVVERPTEPPSEKAVNQDVAEGSTPAVPALQCYMCAGEENCGGAYMVQDCIRSPRMACESRSMWGVTFKQCVDLDDTVSNASCSEFKNSINGVCYRCLTNLCNEPRGRATIQHTNQDTNQNTNQDTNQNTNQDTHIDKSRDGSGGDSKVSHCYSCKYGECKNPEVKYCQSDSFNEISCMSMTYEEKSVKSCYYSDVLENFCDETHTCYICQTNLCNLKNEDPKLQKKGPEVRDAGVINFVSPVLFFAMVYFVIAR